MVSEDRTGGSALLGSRFEDQRGLLTARLHIDLCMTDSAICE